MTESDLRLIETELVVVLPQDYRQLMLANPLAQYSHSAYGADAPPPPFNALMDDVQSIISLNHLFRKEGYIGQFMPATYFCFGSTSGEPYYCLDTSLANSPVYTVGFEPEGYCDLYTDSLQEWVEVEKEEMAELEETMRQEAERQSTKKWWQFWI